MQRSVFFLTACILDIFRTRPGLSFAVVLMKRKRLKGEEKQKIFCVTWIV